MPRTQAAIRLGAIIRRLFGPILQPVLSTSLCFVLLLGLATPLLAQDNPAGAVQAATVSDYLQAQLATTDAPISFLVVLKDQVNAADILTSAGVATAAHQAKAVVLYSAVSAPAPPRQVTRRGGR